uniref:Uncharacterized protein n=1 Tax=Chromera velia CCMP2878 TaxID=1169474 RepID=A0A0G4I6L3_9ALVE|mmetsp:Transcript_53802/g.105234  ORF Transcript_53802/g.105234 Transcript_53802/m.105234 type:complete len:332 (+) Transcript_53802:178-1173(+)|eukprot:Cvel_1902.t1-p1 / transcript=Cvel_1902.t1 / gene=Cvel_1902 / organism=Chromera_velia_CCMP2878 / gene_product=hypothetical protein / transcript_product=hypothetical protein / location=Cvel_scaffold71:62750-65989(+) / protein_length=331 / sequence_SO=supercontig / SO=protein_coding / is_pseudo=false
MANQYKANYADAEMGADYATEVTDVVARAEPAPAQPGFRMGAVQREEKKRMMMGLMCGLIALCLLMMGTLITLIIGGRNALHAARHHNHHSNSSAMLSIPMMESIPLESFERLHSLVLQTGANQTSFYNIMAAHRDEKETELVLSGGDSLVIFHGEKTAELIDSDGTPFREFNWENGQKMKITQLVVESHGPSDNNNEQEEEVSENEGDDNEDRRRLNRGVSMRRVNRAIRYGNIISGAEYNCAYYPCMGVIGVSYPYSFSPRPYPVFGYAGTGTTVQGLVRTPYTQAVVGGAAVQTVATSPATVLATPARVKLATPAAVQAQTLTVGNLG